jgi:hypothetical protein
VAWGLIAGFFLVGLCAKFGEFGEIPLATGTKMGGSFRQICSQKEKSRQPIFAKKSPKLIH